MAKDQDINYAQEVKSMGGEVGLASAARSAELACSALYGGGPDFRSGQNMVARWVN